MLVHESEVTLADTRNRRLFWGLVVIYMENAQECTLADLSWLGDWGTLYNGYMIRNLQHILSQIVLSSFDFHR